MTLARAQEIAKEELAKGNGLVQTTLVGPVLIRALLTDRFLAKSQYIRFDYYRNHREFFNQSTKITKAQAAALLADYEEGN